MNLGAQSQAGFVLPGPGELLEFLTGPRVRPACVKLTETRAWAVWWSRPIDNVTATTDHIILTRGAGAPGTE